MKRTSAIGLARWLGIISGCLALVPGHAQAQVALPRPMGCAEFKPPAGMLEAVYPLPNVARALGTGSKIKILTIGATTVNSRGPNRDYSLLIENYLETTVKGLDVEVVDRSVSGELAARSAERIKFEVALNEPSLVLWQVGTFDAMAQIPIHEFKTTLTKTIHWLRKHNADLVMIGLHYQRGLRNNGSYQSFRKIIEQTTAEEQVLRVGRYEAEELVDRIQATMASPIDKFQINENGHDCLSQVIVRAMATSLFAKRAPDQTLPQPRP